MRPLRLMCGVAWAALLCAAGAIGADEGQPRPALVSVGPGKPQNIGAYPGHEYHRTKKWIAHLRNDPISYALQHWACYDKSHAPQAIALEGQIGMMGPEGENWYQNGFLNFSLDGQQGRNFAIKSVRALDSGSRGSCEFLWELPQAWVRVRFMVIPGQEPLYCSVRQMPKGDKAPLLRVGATCYPSKYAHSAPRVGLTPLQSVKAPKKVQLDPAKEWWVIFYDEKYDLGVEGAVGGCGAIAAPGLVGSAELNVGSYGCTWTLAARPGGRELRFAFWSGLRRKNAELIPYLRGQFPATLKRLEGLDFAVQRFREEGLAALRAEFRKYLAETPGSGEERQAFDTALAKLNVLRPRISGDKINLQAEEEYLTTLEQLDSLLWKLKMRWLFAD